MMHYLIVANTGNSHMLIACGLELTGPHGEPSTPQINLVDCPDCKRAIAMASAIRDRPKGRPTNTRSAGTQAQG